MNNAIGQGTALFHVGVFLFSCLLGLNCTSRENRDAAWSLLTSLRHESARLSEALQELPDLKRIDSKELEALEDIVDLYAKSTNPAVREAFDKMLVFRQEGEYSTPLRVLLHCARTRELEMDRDPLELFPISENACPKLRERAKARGLARVIRFVSAASDSTGYEFELGDLNHPDIIFEVLSHNTYFEHVVGYKRPEVFFPEMRINRRRRERTGADCETAALFAASRLEEHSPGIIVIKWRKPIDGIRWHAVLAYEDRGVFLFDPSFLYYAESCPFPFPIEYETCDQAIAALTEIYAEKGEIIHIRDWRSYRLKRHELFKP